jgi:pimeloyl-ACP methyl ester carboxylesterase
MGTPEQIIEDLPGRAVGDGQLTAANLSVAVDGDTFVYRRFGDATSDAPPLVLLQHFRGNLDSWDPDVVDGLAQDREVVLFDNRGVGGSSGRVPTNVTDMALDALAFIDALGFEEVDLLGFSLGGHVAQEIALLRPRQVRRLVLAGTAPQGAPNLHRWSDAVYAAGTRDQQTAEDAIVLLFSQSEAGRAQGMEYLGRVYARQTDRDQPTDLETRDAHMIALTAWGIPDASKLERLTAITQPVLVANGDNDTMMDTRNSHLLAEHLPDAELRIYEDAGHGFLNQYPDQFVHHVRTFLQA